MRFETGMTVAELKALLVGWSDTDEYGEPRMVWLGNSKSMPTKATSAIMWNLRSEDGTKQWSDLLLSHDR